MKKASVLYIIRGYPQISQTYVKTELEAVYEDYEVTIVSRKPSDVPYRNYYPYHHLTEPEAVRDLIAQVKPDVIHTHYLNQLEFVAPLATSLGIPFTVRSHSYDTLALRPKNWRGQIRQLLERNTPQFQKVANIKNNLHWANHDLCLGVLTFPFARPYLEQAGIRSDKLIDCYPTINYSLFYDRSPNGQAIMNTGAAIPKKKMEDYIELASWLPEQQFNLYALGYQVDRLHEINAHKGNPVNIILPVEPSEMLAEYKKHQWLVYTAAFDLATVGWPMAIAEAQAAGVGVCMPRIRPDLDEYIGGAGYLYNRIEEVRDIITQPVPEEIREAGFRQAKKSDIQEHKYLLTDLWDKAVALKTDLPKTA
ncbi:glycosyltransferase [Kamptonema cortianum]|uniref:Glycosyltransferase n=1 Tax=Geitlerinema calcuttense NRMC-F 0142 TaxID=2922238 RepID=A0ABT7LVC0_9CYAN|nr:glycosyltransferase [Geitlerinema calcuttense]MDK3159712.1 glycosyltransferase [Kamptonema cortianum]MDL5055989.1 glycosyltransferase [Geitlerinema calcuttense NRMC-F 0142]